MKVSRVVSDEMYEEDMEANMRSKKRKNEKEKNLTMLELPQQYKQVTKRLFSIHLLRKYRVKEICYERRIV